MEPPKPRRGLLVKVVLVAVVAAVVVPAALQAYIDGVQGLETTSYQATETSAPRYSPQSACGGCYLVSFTVMNSATTGSVITRVQLNASQVIRVTYHPAALWEPGYWELP